MKLGIRFGIGNGWSPLRAVKAGSVSSGSQAFAETVSRVPTDISGMIIWYRADLGVTLNGSNVSALADQSASGYNASQGTAANQPLFVASGQNSMPAIKGNDGTDNLAVAGMVAPTSMTLFLVMAPSSLANTYHLAGAVNGFGIISRFTGVSAEWLNGADRYTLKTTPDAGLNIATVSQVNAGALIGYWNGAVAFTQTATVIIKAITNVLGAVGNTNATNGDWAELIVFNRVLTTAERTNVHRYLSDRYTITIS